MASEDIGVLYPTQIPGYDDSADIQAALRLYHYGDSEYDVNNTQTNNIVPNSVAGAFNSLDERVTVVENKTTPSEVSATEPSSPTEGYLWLNTAGSGGSAVYGLVADYQASAPTTYLSHGRIWVKSGVTPLEMYIYNSGTSAWDRLV